HAPDLVGDVGSKSANGTASTTCATPSPCGSTRPRGTSTRRWRRPSGMPRSPSRRHLSAIPGVGERVRRTVRHRKIAPRPAIRNTEQGVGRDGKRGKYWTDNLQGDCTLMQKV